MLDMEAFGRRLAGLRRKQNLTQRTVAESCCVSIQAVSKWECGKSCPDLLILDDLAKVLRVEIKDFFEEQKSS